MTEGRRELVHLTERNNFSYLAVALVLLLFALALSDQIGLVLGQAAVESLLMVALSSGVWSIHGERHWYATRLGLLVAIFGLFALRHWLTREGLDLVWLAVVLAYLVLTIASAMRQVLLSGPVDLNKVVGSFCIYLLLGLLWATLYLLVLALKADAFHGLDPGGWHRVFPDLLYFSFATLTTVGYGDISPVAPLARFFAFMEAVVGQFYMAVLVASLVGIGISGRRK